MASGMTSEPANPSGGGDGPPRPGADAAISRGRFLRLVSLAGVAAAAGAAWMFARHRNRKPETYPVLRIAQAGEIPVLGFKIFQYPSPDDPCILVRTAPESYAAYSRICTHLGCAVFYRPGEAAFECPCHEGFFSVADGSVLQGPPPRPLPRVALERRGDDLLAVGLLTFQAITE
jgi:Rieske Fe-S protein